eukprot:scaffold1038_cov122-Isochrysis_galbana.AAC.2
MIDSLTDTALTKGRERSAPVMSHADTHTPLHDGPTGGVPSDKRHSPTTDRQIGSPLGPRGMLVNPTY